MTEGIKQTEGMIKQREMALECAMDVLIQTFKVSRGYEIMEPLDAYECNRLVAMFESYCQYNQGNWTAKKYEKALAKIKLS